MRRAERKLEGPDAGDWFLRQLKMRRGGEWLAKAVTPEGTLAMALTTGVAQGPPGWSTAVWLWEGEWEAWCVGGWVSPGGGWLVLPRGVRLKWPLVGRLLWRANNKTIVTPLRQSVATLEHWRGRGADERDGSIAATLAGAAMRKGAGRANLRACNKLVERWVADVPLHVAGGTVLGMLDIVLSEGRRAFVPRGPEARLVGLQEMWGQWRRRWAQPRALANIKKETTQDDTTRDDGRVGSGGFGACRVGGSAGLAPDRVEA